MIDQNMRSMYRVYVRPTYRWFPFIWYDLIKQEYVFALNKMFYEKMKHRISKKEARAFKKLIDE